jgi:hypothetical protein
LPIFDPFDYDRISQIKVAFIKLRCCKAQTIEKEVMQTVDEIIVTSKTRLKQNFKPLPMFSITVQ